MANYSDLADTLSRSLALRLPPVAVCFTDSIPNGVSSFSGRAPAGCWFWENAAQAGRFATTAADHNLCAIGVYTHNLEPSDAQQQDLADALGIFKQLGYLRESDVSAIPVLRTRARYVLYSPLAQTPLPPDVALLFVDNNQSLILTEAVGEVEDQNPPAMGRPACAVIPQVLNSGKAALSMGCCGARAYLRTLDSNTCIFALPGPTLQVYAERITALAKANQTLSAFHRLRAHEVAAGGSPSVRDSLEALQSA